MKILNELQEIGLSSVQAQIYWAILRSRKATVLELSRLTGLQRPTIYDNVEKLEKLGLVARIVENGKVVLVAEHPRELHKTIAYKQHVANSLVTELMPFYETEPVSKQVLIKFSHSQEGLNRLIEIIPTSKEKVIRTIANYKLNIKDQFTERVLKKLWETRARKGITAKVLYTNEDAQLLKQDRAFSEIGNARFRREVRILPKEIKLAVLYTLVDDNVLFWSSKQEQSSFLIKSQSYADSMKSLFDYLWGVSSVWMF